MKTREATSTLHPVYPFSAIVGQDTLKQALIYNAIDPFIGGVLALGDRGTGKSTAVRALARLLPLIDVMADCPFQCDPARPDSFCSECRTRLASKTSCGAENLPGPSETKLVAVPSDMIERRPVPVVDLPLGATEDRIVGSLDIEAALTFGEKRFAPGLLGRANRGFLYIDEVNLLEDHLIDLLLDVTASGMNVVEREGVSLQHPARFVLVGSGNPEEGDIRPQLLDRFGLFVPVTTISDVQQRVEIVRRRDAFERNPKAFLNEFADAERHLQTKITRARKGLLQVKVHEIVLQTAAALSVALGLDGHRGELVLMRTARAKAAFEGRDVVEQEDVFRLAPLALTHRLRRDPLESIDAGDRVQEAIARVRAGLPQ